MWSWSWLWCSPVLLSARRRKPGFQTFLPLLLSSHNNGPPSSFPLVVRGLVPCHGHDPATSRAAQAHMHCAHQKAASNNAVHGGGLARRRHKRSIKIEGVLAALKSRLHRSVRRVEVLLMWPRARDSARGSIRRRVASSRGTPAAVYPSDTETAPSGQIATWQPMPAFILRVVFGHLASFQRAYVHALKNE